MGRSAADQRRRVRVNPREVRLAFGEAEREPEVGGVEAIAVDGERDVACGGPCVEADLVGGAGGGSDGAALLAP